MFCLVWSYLYLFISGTFSRPQQGIRMNSKKELIIRKMHPTRDRTQARHCKVIPICILHVTKVYLVIPHQR